MEQLITQLKVLQATAFSLYLKAHNYHWNVEGVNFPQYHSFFGDLYDEVWNAADRIAEAIRTLDSYAPASYSRFKELSSIEEETSFPNSGSTSIASMIKTVPALSALNLSPTFSSIFD